MRCGTDPAFKMAVGRLPETVPHSVRSPPCRAFESLPTDTALQADDGRHDRPVLRELPGRCRAASCSTSTTRSTEFTAVSNWRSSTPITTAAGFCRSISTRRRRESCRSDPAPRQTRVVLRSPSSCGTSCAPSGGVGRAWTRRCGRQSLRAARGDGLAGAHRVGYVFGRWRDRVLLDHVARLAEAVAVRTRRGRRGKVATSGPDLT
jgi:hypothetical protein